MTGADYNINVRYGGLGKKTSVSAHNENKADISKTIPKKDKQSGLGNIPIKAAVLGTAMKVNSYVGELTENTFTQKRRQIAMTGLSLMVLAKTNPYAAGLGAAMYVGDSIAQYEIKAYKENLTAGFVRDLSGGVNSFRK